MQRVDLIVGEGATEIVVAQRLLDLAGVDQSQARPLDKRGQGNFWRDFGRYVAAARAGYGVFALVDLESAECPVGLLAEHVPTPRPSCLCLRIAVRSTEAWLLADIDGIADWLRVARSLVPRQPELLRNPKRELVQLARRSQVRRIRESLVPEGDSTGVVGREYLPAISDFIRTKWSPQRGAGASRSLGRALRALKIST